MLSDWVRAKTFTVAEINIKTDSNAVKILFIKSLSVFSHITTFYQKQRKRSRGKKYAVHQGVHGVGFYLSQRTI